MIMKRIILKVKPIGLKWYCTASRQSYKLVIVGGGSAGISFAAKFINKLRPFEILIIEPSEFHYYQPGFTMVAGGLTQFDRTIWHKTYEVIPKNCNWIQEKVTAFHPDKNKLIINNSKEIFYEFLIIAIGVTIDYSVVPNMKEALANPNSGVCSMYDPKLVVNVFPNIQAVKQGNVIFTSPRSKIKCPSAPIKMVLIAEDYFQRKGLRKDVNVMYFTAASYLYAIPYYLNELQRIFKKREISIFTNCDVSQIDSQRKLVKFNHCCELDLPDVIELEYSLLHFTPHQYAPVELQLSPLADPTGFLNVDKFSLRHKKFRNIYGLGDCLNIPTCKTLAASVHQMETVYIALMNEMNLKNKRPKHYDGYTACPIVTSNKTMMLSEFNYYREPTETFPFNQRQESRILYLIKYYIFPNLYWKCILKGRWFSFIKMTKIMKYINKKFKK